jgi:hypothetical protein
MTSRRLVTLSLVALAAAAPATGTQSNTLAYTGFNAWQVLLLGALALGGGTMLVRSARQH